MKNKTLYYLLATTIALLSIIIAVFFNYNHQYEKESTSALTEIEDTNAIAKTGEAREEYIVFFHLNETTFDKDERLKNVQAIYSDFIEIEGTENIESSLQAYPAMLMTLNNEEHNKILKNKLVRNIIKNEPMDATPFQGETETRWTSIIPPF